MPGLAPGIEVVHLQPSQAGDFAQPMQAFLLDTLTGVYRNELGRQVNVLADPSDMSPGGYVAGQMQRITESSDLSEADSAAYVVAVDERQALHNGLVGVLKMARDGNGELVVEEADVALDRRGQRIGPAMLNLALDELAVDSREMIWLEVLRGNKPAQKFWTKLGFWRTGRREHYADVFPDPKDFHHEMQAPESLVHMNVRDLLRSS